MVINANPNDIPYTLLALQELWQNRLNLIVKCYTHSTVANLPEATQRFAQQLERLPADATLPSLTVALIWKNVTITELQCAPTTFIPLYGEANIVRYFTRIGPNEFGYELTLPERSVGIDALLDACYQLSTTPAKQQREQYKKLSTKFNSLATGNDVTVVDIALFSIGKQLNALPKEATTSGWKRATLARLA